MSTYDDYMRAPWMFTEFPWRCRVWRLAPHHLQLWVVEPQYSWEDHVDPWSVPGLGKREIRLSYGTMLTATWREAMEYALHGTMPRLIAQVYPEWCGV